jgi:hypothetical protein
MALLFSSAIFAQNTTTLTGTVTDSDAQAWNYATWTANIVVPGGGIPNFVTGGAVPTSYTGTLSSAGVFSGVVANASAVIPLNQIQWIFTICSNTDAPCVTLPQISVSGSSFNIGTYVSAQIQSGTLIGMPQGAPRFQASNLGYAYNTSEMLGPFTNGVGYVNTSTGIQYLYQNGAFTPTFPGSIGSLVIPIANGGTGATTAASALVNLGTEQSAQGGTGQNSSSWNGIVQIVNGVWSAVGTVGNAIASLYVTTLTTVTTYANNVWSLAVNGVLYADQQTGADEAAKIDAAFAFQAGTSGNPVASVEVDLNPNQNYTVSATTLVIPNSTVFPYIIRPVLDCKGSTITFTGHSFTGGSTDAVTVLSENNLLSGEIRNCYFVFSDTAATFHLYSRPFFKITHNVFGLGTTGITWENNTAAGSPGYSEELVWDSDDFGVPANSAAITLVNDPSAAGSFFYNFFRNIHFDLNGSNSIGFNLTAPSGSPTPEGVGMFGESMDLHVNTGGTGDSIFYLGTSSSVIRSQINITGENDGGTPLYDVYDSNSNATFSVFGDMRIPGAVHGYATGVPLSNVVFLGGNQLIVDDLGTGNGTRTLSAEPQSINPVRMCGNFQVGNTTAFLLADPEAAVDCIFMIGKRVTTSGAPDADQALSSGNPITTFFYVDNMSGGVGIGPGWSAANEPTNTLSVNGSIGATTVVSSSSRGGTFTCTAAGTITISNTNVDSTSDITITLSAAGGTITTTPSEKTITPGTGFSVLCGATDTSIYRYRVWN